MKLRLLFLCLVVVGSLVFLQGCSTSFELIGTSDIDPAAGLSRQDYLALRDRTPPEKEEGEKKTAEIPPIPKMPGGEAEAPKPESALNKLVSVNVTDSVPVRDVLLELVHKTGANLELDPRVQGSVIITAHNQPFEQVLKRICALANLRYTAEGSFIRIVPDEPYQKSYRLDYLSLARHASSDTGISTNVFDVDVGVSGSGNSSSSYNRNSTATENNSTAKVSGISEADFWAETERSIAQILGSGEKRLGSEKLNYSINKQAGMVTVFGTQKQQDAIASYISELRKKAYAQVLIDARIVEVQLDDTYQSGVDWVGVFEHAAGISANFGVQPQLNQKGFFTAGVTGTNFTSLINLVQNFGTTRVLSAPRLTVLNNQTAVMKVATNQVYFVTQAQFATTTTANGAYLNSTPIYTSTPRTVPVGLVMTVQPSIDASSDRVTMTLRPTISRVVGEVEDPSISLNAAVAGVSSSVQSQIPVLAVREMDSVIQLHSGEIAVLGGLMTDSSINNEQGIPGAAEISWLGNLFKSRANASQTSELVVLLRATISDQPAPGPADGNLYQNYTRDPRPIKVPVTSPRLVPEDEETDTNPI